MQIMINGQAGEVTVPDRLVSGSANLYAAEFTFDEFWDGYVKTAVFKADGVSKDAALVDDKCTVPHEVLIPGAVLYVGVYGVNGSVRKPTVWVRAGAVNTGTDQPGTQAPTPTVYEQLLTAMGDLATLKTTSKASLVAAINEIWSLGGGGGGPSIKDASINEAGELVITLADDSVINAGQVVEKVACVKVSLPADGWEALAQSVAVPGVVSDEGVQLITPAPSMASQAAYVAAGVLCTAQGDNSLAFTAKETPTEDLTVYVTIQEVGA